MKPFRKAVVAGVGLIGGSLAAAGKRAGMLGHVVGVGRSAANLEAARGRGLIDEITHDLGAAVADADLVILSAPVDTCVELLRQAVANAAPECMFTDVASVKAPLLDAAARLGVAQRFVGAHPIAGGTGTGAGAADPDLFRGRVVVLTPSAESNPEARCRIGELWRATGAELLELEAGVHDRLLALTSHLPQMLASCLSALADSGDDQQLVARLAGAGFRDSTRIAESDATMWVAIARTNRDNLLAAMDRFTHSWTRLRDAVANGDEATMRDVFERGASLRRKLKPT